MCVCVRSVLLCFFNDFILCYVMTINQMYKNKTNKKKTLSQSENMLTGCEIE